MLQAISVDFGLLSDGWCIDTLFKTVQRLVFVINKQVINL